MTVDSAPVVAWERTLIEELYRLRWEAAEFSTVLTEAIGPHIHSKAGDELVRQIGLARETALVLEEEINRFWQQHALCNPDDALVAVVQEVCVALPPGAKRETALLEAVTAFHLSRPSNSQHIRSLKAMFGADRRATA